MNKKLDMKKLILFLNVCVISISGLAQDKINEKARPIVEEGKRLYRSEMASWYGTDLLLEHTSDRSKVGGYFSYVDNNMATCIFYSKGDQPAVIASVTFDSTYNIKTARMNFAERKFTDQELELYAIRAVARQQTLSDTALFKQYENTNLNLIPIISEGEKKVYVLTGAEKTGVVIFGNDYLLTFDKNNKLKSSKRLHRNIIPISYKAVSDSTKEEVTMHSHLPETGDYITATDICTLMLYEKFTNWKQHNVISDKYLCIWNCKENSLYVITRKVMEKIMEDQEKRK